MSSTPSSEDQQGYGGPRPKSSSSASGEVSRPPQTGISRSSPSRSSQSSLSGSRHRTLPNLNITGMSARTTTPLAHVTSSIPPPSDSTSSRIRPEVPKIFAPGPSSSTTDEGESTSSGPSSAVPPHSISNAHTNPFGGGAGSTSDSGGDNTGAGPSPPSGNSNGGRKTPRRVQWARGTSQPPGTRSAPPLYEEPSAEDEGDGQMMVQLHPDGLMIPVSSGSLLARRLSRRAQGDAGVEGSPGRSVLSLDEEGLDPEAFAALRTALERAESISSQQGYHQLSSRRAPEDVEDYRGRSPRVNVRHSATASGDSSSTRASSPVLPAAIEIPASSSRNAPAPMRPVLRTPRTEGTTTLSTKSDGFFDPRVTNSNTHRNATLGTPAAGATLAAANTESVDEKGRPAAPPVRKPTRRFTLGLPTLMASPRDPSPNAGAASSPNGGGGTPLPAVLEQMQQQPLPPEIPNYIPVGETEGLPVPPATSPNAGATTGGGYQTYEQKARGLVRDHRAGVRSWFRRHEHPTSTTAAISGTNTGAVDLEARAGGNAGVGFTTGRGHGLGGLAHGFGFHHHHSNSHSNSQSRSQSRQGSDDESDDDDRSHSRRRGSVTMKGTGGVLSSLLALYNAQNASGGESDTSRGTTPASSTLDLFNFGHREKTRRSEDGAAAYSARRQQQQQQKAKSSSSSKAKKPIFKLSAGDDLNHNGEPLEEGASASQSTRRQLHERSISMPSVPGSSALASAAAANDTSGMIDHEPLPQPNTPLHASHRSSTTGSSLDGLVKKAIKEPVKAAAETVTGFLDLNRPAAARGGGGVFGALIASTGNLSGGAAPAASAIAPTLKRPGYHLSRYSLDATKAKEIREETEKNRLRAQASQSHLGDGPFASAQGSRAPSPSTTRDDNRSAARTPDIETMYSPASPGQAASQGPSRDSGYYRGGVPATRTVTNATMASTATSGTTPKHSRHASAAGIVGELLHLPRGMHTPAIPLPWTSKHGSRSGSPVPSEGSGVWNEKDYFGQQGKDKKSAHRRRKEKRKREEIFITMHVAEILQRQEFILKLARALMMFGAPSHRLEAQLQATAKVLDINVSVINLPNIMLLSFGDPSTHTSETKFLKQGPSLDLAKLRDAHMLYWRVTHDEIGVTEASAALDVLMLQKPVYRGWMTVLIGGLCSAFITPVSFNGSFIDALISFPLGCLLVWIQNRASKNELYSNVFEITVACVSSFLAAALASTHKFCYAAVASGSVVLILPGYIVLTGSLELASRGIISGAVRMGYSVIYSLFLGFGLAIGGEIYSQITGQQVYNADDYQCGATHDPNGPWYQQTASVWWAFLCVPMYSLVLSMRNQGPVFRKEMFFTILFACSGWVANHFASKKFVNRADISSACGSLVVGVLGNLYGRVYYGNAFVVMITGILFQLPSGLSNGGLLAFASQTQSGSTTSYATGFQTAEQLVQVAIGLTVGLFVASVLVHPFQSRRRGAGLFSL